MTAATHRTHRSGKNAGRGSCARAAEKKTSGAATRAFFSEIAQGASAKTVWGSMRRSRCRRAQRGGCDPAAIPNARNGETTQGKPLKNALIRRHKKLGALKREGKAWLGRNETRQSIFSEKNYSLGSFHEYCKSR